MSINISEVFQKSFDARVKQSYQGKGVLVPCVRVARNVVGSTHDFRKVGKGLAQERGALQTDVTPMDVDYSKATATLQNWVAPEYTDIFSKPKINFDETTTLVEVVAGAIGRRMDQLLIDAMDSSANTTQVGINEGGTNSSMIVEKFTQAKYLMDDKGVPSSDRYLALSAASIRGALREEEVGSADYNTIKALAQGDINTYCGFTIKMIETREEGGLPLDSTVRTNFAFHGGSMGAVGLAMGMDFKTEINYVAEKTSYLVNGLFSAGAVTIDTDGVYDVLTYEA